MKTNNTELSGEQELTDIGKLRQLEMITHLTGRWMGVLFHDCNGVLSNVNWISRISQDEQGFELLPTGTFEELTKSSEKGIHSLKSIYTHIQLLNKVGARSQVKEDLIGFDLPLLTSINPLFKQFNFSITNHPIFVSSVFLDVLNYLLKQVVACINALDVKPLDLKFLLDTTDEKRLHVILGSTTSFWTHIEYKDKVYNEQLSLGDSIFSQPCQMFYELMELVGGTIHMGSKMKTYLEVDQVLGREDLGLLHQENSVNRLSFSIPFELDVQ